jgi:flagellar basal-body rod modification protein FlgD
MEISGIGSVSSITQAAQAQAMDKDDFMTLLLKQLSNQDPLNPMDSAQFTSQLTEFSSLEALTNIKDSLEGVLAYQQSMQNATVANLIDKSVETEGDSFYMQDNAEVGYELDRDAASVMISVYDSSGAKVWSGETGEHMAGVNTFKWNGKDIEGNQLSAGNYSFGIDAKDISGNAVEASTIEKGLVTGISFEDGLTYLTLDGNRKINLSDIKSISL